MFRGINVINVETKGRFAIPIRYRDQLDLEKKNQLIMTIDTEEPCLLLYPLVEWEIIEAKLSQLPSFDPLSRRVQRLLIGHATECELDTQGRLLISPELREYAGIDKKLVLLGQSNKFEIWSEDIWHRRRSSWIEAKQAHSISDDLKSISL